MSGTLLTISIGPVQNFIQAARRTRDFWFGSNMISEISRSVARQLSKDDADLIFPNVIEKKLPVANVVLALLKDSADPRQIVCRARSRAQSRWTSFADKALQVAQGRLGEWGCEALREKMAREQMEGVLEFRAAWVPLADDDCAYPKARESVFELLAARKRSADFEKARAYPTLPKSSLDGRRESIICRRCLGKKEAAKVEAALRITSGEQLDIVGLTKRWAGGDPRFPSTVRVAADPWLRGAEKHCGPEWEAFLKTCDGLKKRQEPFLKRRTHIKHCDERFPFDGNAVYSTRFRATLRETCLRPPSADNGRRGQLNRKTLLRSGLDPSDVEAVDKTRQAIEKRRGEADPYLAVLKADGDRMGDLIKSKRSPEEHKCLSRVLSTFASAARDTVEEHFGALVYSGGDDVLALLPVDQCLPCARALHDKFAELLKGQAESDAKAPTLSVGIAIGHLLTDLEEFLDNADKAEKDAKNGRCSDETDSRNGLAVHVFPRSGVAVRVRDQWTGDDDSLDCRFNKWIDLFAGGFLSTKLPHDLRQLVPLYKDWPCGSDREKALKADALRVAARKSPRDVDEASREKVRKLLEGVKGTDDLTSLCEEMLVALRIGRSSAQLKPPSKDLDAPEPEEP